MQGLGYDPNLLQVVLVQMVQLTRGGEPVRMGKRTGEFMMSRCASPCERARRRA